MTLKEIRWKQRFNNLKKAYGQLSDADKKYAELSVLEKEGLVQRFEYTFELSWKTLKDYLESKGVVTQFPREAIKGLTEEQNATILREARRFKMLTRLVVFGSRAMGNQKKGSDIDLAVWGLDENETRELKIQLNEYTNLPHKFDVIRFESLNNPELKQHIIDFGKTIFPLRRKQRSDPANPTG